MKVKLCPKNRKKGEKNYSKEPILETFKKETNDSGYQVPLYEKPGTPTRRFQQYK